MKSIKDILETTQWQKTFLSGNELAILSRYLSSDTPKAFFKIIQHPNLDEKTFFELFEKAERFGFFDPKIFEQPIGDREEIIFKYESPSFTYQKPVLSISYAILLNRHCPKEVVFRHLSKQQESINFFLENTKSPHAVDCFHHFLNEEFDGSDYWNKRFALSLVSNINCPTEFIDEHFLDSKPIFLKSIMNPNASERVLNIAWERLEEKRNANERRDFFKLAKSLASNKNLPTMMVDSIVSSWKAIGNEQVLIHPNLSLGKAVSLVQYFHEERKKISNDSNLSSAKRSAKIFEIERILDKMLSHHPFSEDLLDYYFAFYPLSVLKNPKFNQWDKVDSLMRSIFFDDEHVSQRQAFFNVIFLRNAVPKQIMNFIEQQVKYENNHLFNPTRLLSHPSVSMDFVKPYLEQAYQELRSDNDDESMEDVFWSAEEILSNYSANPNLSLHEMLKFCLQTDAPYQLFSNPKFGGLPQDIKAFIFSHVMVKEEKFDRTMNY